MIFSQYFTWNKTTNSEKQDIQKIYGAQFFKYLDISRAAIGQYHRTQYLPIFYIFPMSFRDVPVPWSGLYSQQWFMITGRDILTVKDILKVRAVARQKQSCLESTCHVFQTVYSICKAGRSFTGLPSCSTNIYVLSGSTTYTIFHTFHNLLIKW